MINLSTGLRFRVDGDLLDIFDVRPSLLVFVVHNSTGLAISVKSFTYDLVEVLLGLLHLDA